MYYAGFSEYFVETPAYDIGNAASVVEASRRLAGIRKSRLRTHLSQAGFRENIVGCPFRLAAVDT